MTNVPQPSAPDLLKAYDVIRSLYRKNTTETVSILKRIEEELQERGYVRIDRKFYKAADLRKLTPLSHD